MTVKLKPSKYQQGFTLIELVLGMTVMVVVIGFMMVAMLPKEQESADQIHLIQATELAQSFVNEITAKAFDENSDMSGGLIRCNETGGSACTSSNSLGAEELVRSLYDDVDDYDGLNSSVNDLEDSLGSSIEDIYHNFHVQVSVYYDNNYDGIADSYDGTLDNSILVKLITITVTTPLDTRIAFAVYKANIE
ncbi:prepilin-type N-terminal cleavage/methylation domain-containing protein [Thalassotalea fonticola]|uniref:Prepilin-type N-terminal cleavage/methylation domain-containing protein n=1 Tax=Thalassotalea fonticola TaxID=3065649 RepID=A0ABZ0GIZ7_9GAMM|nr:prepilin-type N-terminal cleavage/methylation domain-containing protein [Colwelliaceae bacterium S1-1]